MTIQLSPLVNMGVVVPDAEEAFRLLHFLFGAEKIQEELSNFLSGDTAKVIHVGIGDIVLQYIEPLAKEGIWYDQIQEKGSGIHHLTYTVDDIKATVKELEKKGGILPLSAIDIEWENLIQSDFTNPNATTIYIMNTMEKFGFHLAIIEKPGRSDLILPETHYATGSNKLIGDASTMLHIELVTSDAEKTFNTLHKLFGTEKVEIEFANILDSEFMHIIHVNLSNIVLQYCQPIVKEGTWHELLQKNGAYIHNLNWSVDTIKETVRKFKKEGTPRIFKQRLGGPESPPFYMYDTLKPLGFHLENGQTPTTEEGYEFVKNWLFIDFKKD
ncbi:MAG: VOC family protein [Promethearchaeota archaeon]|jgi:predicted enzyme related to lactoylglutathione lyase